MNLIFLGNALVNLDNVATILPSATKVDGGYRPSFDIKYKGEENRGLLIDYSEYARGVLSPLTYDNAESIATKQLKDII